MLGALSVSAPLQRATCEGQPGNASPLRRPLMAVTMPRAGGIQKAQWEEK